MLSLCDVADVLLLLSSSSFSVCVCVFCWGAKQAVKIFDRAELMRRGARFSRPRARGPDGALLPLDVNAAPENYIKVDVLVVAILQRLS